MPSGVDASTGEVAGVAVQAVATATFAAAKPGLWINPGRGRAGGVRVVDIGIPPGAPVDPPDVGLIDDDALLALVPRRHAGWTKFDSGHVLVAGGARGLTGAPCLAAEAAQRSGAGYVTACVPETLETIFELRLLEAMSRGLPDRDGAHTAEGAAVVLELAARGGALVAGPGVGRTDGAVAFVRRVVGEAEVALVLDADGLNAFAGDLAALAARRAPSVLTPHEGELGRLLGVGLGRGARPPAAPCPRGGAARRRRSSSSRATTRWSPTPTGSSRSALARRRRWPPRAPATSSAASIATMLARGVEPFAAACAGVRLHARAGVHAAAERGVDGVIARDVIESLPHAW